MHHSKAAGCQWPAGINSGQHSPGHSCPIRVQVCEINIFPKERKDHVRKKCWNIDGIIYTCNIDPASASRLCPKEPKYDCFLLFASVSGWQCLWRRWCSAQLPRVVVGPVPPHHPVPVPAGARALPLQRYSSGVFVLFIQKSKDSIHQTCSLIAVCSFDSTK